MASSSSDHRDRSAPREPPARDHRGPRDPVPGALHRLLPRVRRRPPARRPERGRERDLARAGGRDARRRALPRRLGLGEQPEGRPRPRRRPPDRGGPPARRGRRSATSRRSGSPSSSSCSGSRPWSTPRRAWAATRPIDQPHRHPLGVALVAQRARVSVGSSDGVIRNSPVLAGSQQGAALVGIVTNVSSSSADVAFITDGRTEVGARIPDAGPLLRACSRPSRPASCGCRASRRRRRSRRARPS